MPSKYIQQEFFLKCFFSQVVHYIILIDCCHCLETNQHGFLGLVYTIGPHVSEK